MYQCSICSRVFHRHNVVCHEDSSEILICGYCWDAIEPESEILLKGLYMALTSELFDKWVTALESGEYVQLQNMLVDPIANRYCCLGVLSKLQVPAIWKGEEYLIYPSEKHISQNMQLLLMELNDLGPADNYARVIAYLRSHRDRFVTDSSKSGC